MITAEILSPLVIPRYRGNLSLQQTLDFVPGPTFRGALAYAMAETFERQGDEIKSVFSRFQGNRIQVSSLLPRPGEGGYGLPVPLSAWGCKSEKEHPVVDMLSVAGGSLDSCNKCGSVLDPCGSGFMKADTNILSLIPVLTMAGTHVEIDDKTGLSKKQILFSLESIAPGQCFAGFVKFSTPDDEAKCWQLINKDNPDTNSSDLILGIGQGPSRGRGLVKINVERNEDEDWSDIINSFNGGDIEKRLTAYNNCSNGSKEWENLQECLVPVTLVSDTLLLQGNMTYATGLNPACFKACLGVDGVDVKLKKAFTSHTVVSGWNREHGRQKIQEPAIAMGSTFLFEVSFNGVTPQKLISALKLLEDEGIGIRRQEGFGRVVIAHPFHHISDPTSAQTTPAIRPREHTVTLPSLLSGLQRFIKRAAFELMASEFHLNSSNIHFLNRRKREVEFWCQDAARKLHGTDMDNRTKRLELQGKRDVIEEAWILDADGRLTDATLQASDWLKARLNMDWGKVVLKKAFALMASEFSVPERQLHIEFEDKSDGFKLILYPDREEKTIDKKQAEEWYWMGVKEYFFSLKTRASGFEIRKITGES